MVLMKMTSEHEAASLPSLQGRNTNLSGEKRPLFSIKPAKSSLT